MRPQLVDLLVHEEVVRQRQPVLGLRQKRLAHDRFEKEPGAAVVRRVVRDQLGLARIQLLNGVEPVVERGVHAADERRDAGDLDHPAVTSPRAVAHEPQLVTDQDLRSRRVPGRAQRPRSFRGLVRLHRIAPTAHSPRLDAHTRSDPSHLRRTPRRSPVTRRMDSPRPLHTRARQASHQPRTVRPSQCGINRVLRPQLVRDPFRGGRPPGLGPDLRLRGCIRDRPGGLPWRDVLLHVRLGSIGIRFRIRLQTVEGRVGTRDLHDLALCLKQLLERR